MEEASAIFHDSVATTAGQIAKRGKMLKRDSVSVGAAHKRILGDITNTDQQLQPKHHPEPPLAPPATDASIDDLRRENAGLIQLLAHRNAIIESCKAELQKFRSNFQILRKQNSELALTNSLMMAELNSCKQRMRELQLEIGSKNGILKAMKLELLAKDHKANVKCDIDPDESKQSDQKFQKDNRGAAKRKRVCKSQSSAPAVVKQVKSVPNEDLIEVDKVKYDASHLRENLANENASTSLGSKVHDVAREDTEPSEPTNPEKVHAKKNIEKRLSLRRQSARFKDEDPFNLDDAKFKVSNLCDSLSEKSLPTAANAENNACVQELRRSSIGRPLRQSTVKITSYKEIPINVKMRRS